MSKNNYMTVENNGGVYRIILANVNGKKISSRTVFSSRAAAMVNAAFMAHKRNVRFVSPTM